MVGKVSVWGKSLFVSLALALVVGCMPAVAFAQPIEGAELGEVGLASESLPSLGSAYLPVLIRAASGTDEFAGDYRAADSARWNPTFALYDLGDDGVPELLVRTSAFADNSVVHVFSVKRRNVVSLGSYWEGSGTTAGDGAGRLYVAASGRSTVALNELSIEGGKLVSKFLRSGQSERSLLAEVNATALEMSDVDDRETLEAEARYSIEKAVVTVGSGGKFTGQPKTPAVTAKFAGVALEAGADYELSYQNNKYAGQASATLVGIGKFKGVQSAAFSIAQAANPMVVSGSTQTLGRAALAKKAQTVRGITFAAKAKGPVSYQNASSKTIAALAKVNAKTGAITMKKGTKAGTYAVKVQVDAAGTANYKAKSKVVTVKVRVK